MSATDRPQVHETEAEFLDRYDLADHPPTAVTVDAVVLTVRSGRLHVLLIERGGHPDKGRWALPGGFARDDETLEEAVLRETEEEVGISLGHGHVEQLATYGDPGRDPRGHVVSVAHLAFIPEVPLPDAGSDAAAARFWAVDDLTDGYGPPLAFDHGRILADAVERARSKLEYTTLATRFVPDPFTIGDLYAVYHAVWGVEPGDRANFARKVRGTAGFVVEAEGLTTSGGRGRPSTLYRAGPATTLHPPILRPA